MWFLNAGLSEVLDYFLTFRTSIRIDYERKNIWEIYVNTVDNLWLF